MAKTSVSKIRQTTPWSYYSEKGGVTGIFLGALAAFLGLAGKPAVRGVYEGLLDGFGPDGVTKLVRNAGLPSRFPGWDVCISMPKSFDIFQLLHPESQADFAAAFELALESVIRYLEDTCAWARRGAGGAC